MNFGTKAPADAAKDDQTVNKPEESNPGQNSIVNPTQDPDALAESHPTVTLVGEQNNSPEALKARLEQSDSNKPTEGKDKDQTYESTAKPQPSVESLGIDVEQVQERDPIAQVFAEVRAADSGITNANVDDDLTVYSSHPVQRLHIGAYQFEDTILRLKPDQVADFETLLKGLPPQDRLNIRKIDTGKADQIVRDRLDATSTATRAFDSSVGRSALQQLQRQVPIVGTQELESMNDPKLGLMAGAGNEQAIVETKPDNE